MKKEQTIWTKSQGDYTLADIDRWSSPPSDSVWSKLVGGVVLPVLILWPATDVLVHKVGYIPGRWHTKLEVSGTDAVFLGLVLTFGSLFFHTHYFWGNSRRLIMISGLGKTVALLGFCTTLIMLLWRQWNRF